MVALGLAASRDRAQALIAAGHVAVDGLMLKKPAKKLLPNADIKVTAKDLPWVSRAALKLVGGLTAFPSMDPAGLYCVDIGASTGGFTEVLLARGAAHSAPLRSCPRAAPRRDSSRHHLDVSGLAQRPAVCARKERLPHHLQYDLQGWTRRYNLYEAIPSYWCDSGQSV